MNPLFIVAVIAGVALVVSSTGVAKKGATFVSNAVDRVHAAATAAHEAANRAVLLAVLPASANPYVDVILRVAREDGVSPFLLAAIMQRESKFGAALKPAHAGGTGDFIPRTVTNSSYPVPQGAKVEATTIKKKDGTVVPARKITPTSNGWGHGLMQIDLGAHATWLSSGKWRDPYENVKYGSKVLRESSAFIKSKIPGITPELLARAAVAGYNTGAGNVVKSLQAGKDPDATTHGGDYSKSVVGTALAWAISFADKIGVV